MPNFVEYGDWSDWSECSAECGGGSRSRSRVCPTPNGACGGPDVAMIFDVCNNIRCIEGMNCDTKKCKANSPRLLFILIAVITFCRSD